MIPANNISGMPKMRAAFAGWFQSIILNIVTQTIEDGLVIETIKQKSFRGIIQPLSAEELRLKPEGERSWPWLQIHAIAGSLNLNTNDKIQYNGIKYKIMAVLDYSLNGFIEYHGVRDFE